MGLRVYAIRRLKTVFFTDHDWASRSSQGLKRKTRGSSRVGSGGDKKIKGQLGSRQVAFEIRGSSRIESGRIRR